MRTLKTVLAIIAVCFVSAVIVAGCAEPVATTIPPGLPLSDYMRRFDPPAADIPEWKALFLGTWIGWWAGGGDPDIALSVTNVDPADARVWYVRTKSWRFPPGAFRRRGEWDGRTLVVEFPEVGITKRFTMQPGGWLLGEVIEQGRKTSEGPFKRLERAPVATK